MWRNELRISMWHKTSIWIIFHHTKICSSEKNSSPLTSAQELRVATHSVIWKSNENIQIDECDCEMEWFIAIWICSKPLELFFIYYVGQPYLWCKTVRGVCFEHSFLQLCKLGLLRQMNQLKISTMRVYFANLNEMLIGSWCWHIIKYSLT